MDKNTIWAIVLSTLVIVGSYFLLPKLFGKNKAAQNTASVEVVSENTKDNSQANQKEILTDTLFDEESSALLSEAETENASEEEAPVLEEKITINTGPQSARQRASTERSSLLFMLFMWSLLPLRQRIPPQSSEARRFWDSSSG